MKTINDDSKRLVEIVKKAAESKTPLSIQGFSSKAFHIQAKEGLVLQTTDHCGIEEYRPEELVVTVRAGTSIEELRDILSEHNQILPADPPTFDGIGSIGGAVATGFSGPSRPWYGSIRDSILGVEMVNGRGERMKFGGQVMKNVAGYDLSRLMAGSFGTLGLILAVSLKVLPKPRFVGTLTKTGEPDELWELYRRLRDGSFPVTATCQLRDSIWIRLAGNFSSIESMQHDLGMNTESNDELWSAIRDQVHPFFSKDVPYWRVSLPRGSRLSEELDADALREWHGSLAWVRSLERPTLADSNLGYISPFRSVQEPKRQRSKYADRLKHAFDPYSIFNVDIVV